MKERRKRRQWVCPLIRKRDSKEAYYLITNGLGLTDKEDFRKFRYSKLNIVSKNYVSTFSVQSSLQLMFASIFTSLNSETKENILHK